MKTELDGAITLITGYMRVLQWVEAWLLRWEPARKNSLINFAYRAHEGEGLTRNHIVECFSLMEDKGLIKTDKKGRPEQWTVELTPKGLIHAAKTVVRLRTAKEEEMKRLGII